MLFPLLEEDRDGSNPTRLYPRKLEEVTSIFLHVETSPYATTMSTGGEVHWYFLNARHDLCLLRNFQWLPIACRMIFKFLRVTLQAFYTWPHQPLWPLLPTALGEPHQAACPTVLQRCDLLPYLFLWLCFCRSAHLIDPPSHLGLVKPSLL